MRVRKRAFTLLEVLIALALVALSLPLLISPFLYIAVDQQESAAKLKLKDMAGAIHTQLMLDLHRHAIHYKELESEAMVPVKEEWLKIASAVQVKGHYQFKRVSQIPKEEPSKNPVELWQVNFYLLLGKEKNPQVFGYMFVTVKEKPSTTPVEPPPETKEPTK